MVRMIMEFQSTVHDIRVSYYVRYYLIRPSTEVMMIGQVE
jgi:hypothetical protein